MEKYETETGGFKSLGEFLIATRKHCDGERMDSRLKVMTEGIDTAGGVLVPPKLSEEVFHVALEDAIVRPRAIVLPVGTDTLDIPRLVDSDRSTNIFGGVTFSWLKEAADKIAGVGDPKLGRIKLSVHEGVASCWVSNRLEDDVKNFGEFIKIAFGRAVAFYEDVYYIWGNGNGQPLGIIPSSAVAVPSRTSVAKVDIPDIGKMGMRFLPGSWKKAVWLISQSVLGEWVGMQAAAANSASVLNLAEMICLGRPVIVSEKCSPMGTKGDIILADFSHYVIGDRELIISASRHVPDYWQKNMTFWKLVIRVDGRPTLDKPITPYKGADTVSAFVTLDTTS